MASVYYLYQEIPHFNRDLSEKYLEVGDIARTNHFAALIIQRSWRGYVVRKMIKHWHACATIIESWVRGWLVRWHLPIIYKEYYDYIAVKFYNDKAAKIQALWKGYKVRQTLSIKDILAKRKQIEEANKNMQDLLRAEFAKLDENSPEAQERCLRRVLEEFFHRHHLLRTTVMEGVLSTHGSKELSELEKILKNIPYTQYMLNLRKIRNQP